MYGTLRLTSRELSLIVGGLGHYIEQMKMKNPLSPTLKELEELQIKVGTTPIRES